MLSHAEVPGGGVAAWSDGFLPPPPKRKHSLDSTGQRGVARDFAQVKSNGEISIEIAKQTLDLLDIDDDGLDEMDLRIISTLIEKFDGGPVGLNSLSVSVSEESSTLEEVHEPFLIQEGFIKRTPKGRVATLKSYDKLGLSPN